MSHDFYDTVDLHNNLLTTGRGVINNIEQDASYKLDEQSLFTFQPFIESECKAFPENFSILGADDITPSPYPFTYVNVTDTSIPFSKCICATHTYRIYSDYIPVHPNTNIYTEVWAKCDVGVISNGRLDLGIKTYNSSLTLLNTMYVESYAIIPPSGIWNKYTHHDIYAPTYLPLGNVQYIRPFIRINIYGTSDITAPMYFGGWSVRYLNIVNDTGQYNIHGDLSIDTLTPDRVVYANANKELISSDVSSTELSYLSDVTSNIQTQLDTKLLSDDPILTNASTSTTIGHVKAPPNIPLPDGITGAIGTTVDTYATSDHSHPVDIGMPWVRIATNIVFNPETIYSLNSGYLYIDTGRGGLCEICVTLHDQPVNNFIWHATLSINGDYGISSTLGIATILQFTGTGGSNVYGRWLFKENTGGGPGNFGVFIANMGGTTDARDVYYRKIGGIAPDIISMTLVDFYQASTPTICTYLATQASLAYTDIPSIALPNSTPATQTFTTVRAKLMQGCCVLSGYITMNTSFRPIIGTDQGTLMTVLPAGYKPTTNIVLPAPTYGYMNGSSGRIRESSNIIIYASTGEMRSLASTFSAVSSIGLEGLTYYINW